MQGNVNVKVSLNGFVNRNTAPISLKLNVFESNFRQVVKFRYLLVN